MDDYKEWLHCPVDNKPLGIRIKGQPTEVFCKECNFFYVYEASPTHPVSNRKPKKKCNCPQCREL